MTGTILLPGDEFAKAYATEVEARWAMFRRAEPQASFAIQLLIVGTTFGEMVACMFQGDEWVGATHGLRWTAQRGWE